jgi:hypothetical protein
MVFGCSVKIYTTISHLTGCARGEAGDISAISGCGSLDWLDFTLLVLIDTSIAALYSIYNGRRLW